MDRVNNHSDSDIFTTSNNFGDKEEFSCDELKKLKRIILSSSFRNLKQARRRFRNSTIDAFVNRRRRGDDDNDNVLSSSLDIPEEFSTTTNDHENSSSTVAENNNNNDNNTTTTTDDKNMNLNSWKKEIMRHIESESGQCSGEGDGLEKTNKPIQKMYNRNDDDDNNAMTAALYSSYVSTDGSHSTTGLLKSSFLIAEIEALEQLLDDQEGEIYSLEEKLAYYRKESRDKNNLYNKTRHDLESMEDTCVKVKTEFAEAQSLDDTFRHELTQLVMARDLQLANSTNECNQLVLYTKSLEKRLRQTIIEEEQAKQRADDNETKLTEAFKTIMTLREKK